MKRGTRTLAAALLASQPARRELQHQLDLEHATMKLLAVTGPDGIDAALAEVGRQQELFTSIRLGSPRGGEVPRLAAFDSVTHDAIQGRFG